LLLILIRFQEFRWGLDVTLLLKFEQISDQKSKNLHVTGKIDPTFDGTRVTGKTEVILCSGFDGSCSLDFKVDAIDDLFS